MIEFFFRHHQNVYFLKHLFATLVGNKKKETDFLLQQIEEQAVAESRLKNASTLCQSNSKRRMQIGCIIKLNMYKSKKGHLMECVLQKRI